MENVVKLRGWPVSEPIQFVQVDNGNFGCWYFDVDTFDHDPSPSELLHIGHEDRLAYYASQLRPVKVKVTACINDKGLGCEAVVMWVTPEEFEARTYLGTRQVTEAMRGAISNSMQWVSETLGMLGIGSARDEVDRARGHR